MGIIQFSEYKEYVILSYKRLRDKGDLPSNLKRPTPAKLKNECLFVLSDKDRNSEKDIDTLRSFFGPKKDLNEYSHAIKKFGTDKCRPLNKFLKKGEGNTDDKNIELLALLIDFKPRPFIFGKTSTEDIELPEEQVNTKGPDDSEETKTPPSPIDPPTENQPDGPETPEEKTSPLTEPIQNKLLSRKITGSIAILALLVGGLYISKEHWTTAYICEHGTGKKYHLSANCPALKICKNGIVETTIAEAEKNGKTLCNWDK
jgi:hypothetical protein